MNKHFLHGRSVPPNDSAMPIHPDKLRHTLFKWSRANEYIMPDGIEGAILERAQAGNWEGVLRIVNTPFRFTFLNAVKQYLSPTEFWRSFKFIWRHCENSWEDMPLIISLLAFKKGGAHLMMTDQAQRAFSRLPDTIHVYRGATSYNQFGLSWTLLKPCTEWFAANRQSDPSVFCLTSECQKTNVFGLFLERAEEEILILPKHVKLLDIKSVPSVARYMAYVHTKVFARRSIGLVRTAKATE